MNTTKTTNRSGEADHGVTVKKAWYKKTGSRRIFPTKPSRLQLVLPELTREPAFGPPTPWHPRSGLLVVSTFHNEINMWM
jgi:hypothetical protein